MLGSAVAGLVLVASAALGAGTASADTVAPSRQAPCSRALLPLLTGTQQQLCAVALGLTGSATGGASSAVTAVPRIVQQAPQVIPRVVQGSGGAVTGTVSGVTGSGSSTRAPAAGTSGRSGTSGTSTRSGAASRPVAIPTPAAVPLAPTRNYDTLLSSAYDRVPTGLLATAPSGGAGASLVAPAGFSPNLLAPGRPTRLLGGPENGVTTSSSAGPAYYTAGDRLGTPMLVGVLVLSSVLALLVRSAVLRRSRRVVATG